MITTCIESCVLKAVCCLWLPACCCCRGDHHMCEEPECADCFVTFETGEELRRHYQERHSGEAPTHLTQGWAIEWLAGWQSGVAERGSKFGWQSWVVQLPGVACFGATPRPAYQPANSRVDGISCSPSICHVSHLEPCSGVNQNCRLLFCPALALPCPCSPHAAVGRQPCPSHAA